MLQQGRQIITGIQILRGFAALAVALFHWSLFSQKVFGTPYVFDKGGAGVYLFFVISGFVLWNPKERNPLIFLAHRVIRIYPGYIGAIAVATIVKLLFLGTMSVFTLESLSLMPLGLNISHPLGIEWTLIYEIYFYCVLTISLMLPSALRKFVPVLWLILLLASVFIYRGAFFRNHPDMLYPAYFSICLSSYGLPFVMGAITRQINNTRIDCHRTILIMLFLMSLIGIQTIGIQSITLDNGEESSYGNLLWDYRSLIWGFGFSCVVLLFAITSFDANNKVISILKRLGDYSYGLYLLHVTIFKTLFSIYNNAGLAYPSIGLLLLALLAGLAVGNTFGAIESRPIQRTK